MFGSKADRAASLSSAFFANSDAFCSTFDLTASVPPF